MRFIVKKQQLTGALQKLKGVLPPKSWHMKEIFSHVLVQASDMGITLTATNGDIRLSMRLGLVESARVIEMGSYAVGYAGLIEALKGFPRKADLLFCLEERGLSVACDNLLPVQVVNGCDAGEFPGPMVLGAVGTTYEVEEWNGTFGHEYYLQKNMSKHTYQVLHIHEQRLAYHAVHCLRWSKKSLLQLPPTILDLCGRRYIHRSKMMTCVWQQPMAIF